MRSAEIHQHPYAECKSPTNQKHAKNSVETSESGGFYHEFSPSLVFLNKIHLIAIHIYFKTSHKPLGRHLPIAATRDFGALSCFISFL